jgi:hypothetical protein
MTNAHMEIHSLFAKLMDGTQQIARIHALNDGLWACVPGTDYGSQFETTHEVAQQWLATFAATYALSRKLAS